MCVPRKFHVLFWDFEVTFPLFSSVLILMVCLHFLNCSPFEKYGRFDFQLPNWLFYFYRIWKFGNDLPPYFQVVMIMVSLFAYKSLGFCPNYWLALYFCQIYVVMSSFAQILKVDLNFAKFMKLFQVLSKLWGCAFILPKLWGCVNIRQNYGGDY